MTKITIIPSPQNSTEFEPRNFTQVGGIYGLEIKPEEYLIPAGILPERTSVDEFQYGNDPQEARFFRVR